MQQAVTRSAVVETSAKPFADRILLLYYAATAIFVVLDYALNFNIRVAFLAPLPAARIAYYGVCFACLALMLWRPAWTVLISAFESLVTLGALIIAMGMRVVLMSDRVLETGTGIVTIPEVCNFLIAGGIAYLAWVKGIRRLRDEKYR